MLAAFTACQKDELPQSGAATSQTISVTVPQGIQTRATGDGDGSMVNRCILEIYRDGALYGERKVSTVTSGKATFSDLRLVAQQTYDFVFWADCADNGVDKYYDTESGLTQISAKEYKGNEERFDAFFLCQKDYKVEASFNETGWVLKRPFGQLNIKTDDLDDIPTELQPDAVSVVFKNLPTSFNALEGVTNEATQEEVTYKANILDAASGKLTVDYLWASEEESATLSDFHRQTIDRHFRQQVQPGIGHFESGSIFLEHRIFGFDQTLFYRLLSIGRNTTFKQLHCFERISRLYTRSSPELIRIFPAIEK